MALNDDWVADVRRWYFDERPHDGDTVVKGLPSDLADGAEPIGYEAAQPALQSHLRDAVVLPPPRRSTS